MDRRVFLESLAALGALGISLEASAAEKAGKVLNDFSFRKKKAKNIVKMGPRVPMSAVSIAEDMVIAIRKVICGTKRPISEAAAIFGKSFRSTFSFGRNAESSQKSRLAPRARRVKRTYGDTVPEVAISLQNTMFSPKMT